jgi:hypothetical protein
MPDYYVRLEPLKFFAPNRQSPGVEYITVLRYNGNDVPEELVSHSLEKGPYELGKKYAKFLGEKSAVLATSSFPLKGLLIINNRIYTIKCDRKGLKQFQLGVLEQLTDHL